MGKKMEKGMVLTNQEIFATEEPLATLMGQKFHVRVSYNLAKLASKLNEQLKVIHEVRDIIIKKHGEPDPQSPQQSRFLALVEKTDASDKVIMEDGKPVMVANPSMEKFTDEMTELMDKEETIDFGKLEIPVKLPEMIASTCDKCHNNMDKALELTPRVLLFLEKFVEVVERLEDVESEGKKDKSNKD